MERGGEKRMTEERREQKGGKGRRRGWAWGQDREEMERYGGGQDGKGRCWGLHLTMHICEGSGFTVVGRNDEKGSMVVGRGVAEDGVVRWWRGVQRERATRGMDETKRGGDRTGKDR